MTNPPLITLFNNVVENAAPYWAARLYTITPPFGAGVIRFTDADCDIMGVSSTAPTEIVAGNTYSSGGIRVDQKQSKTQAHLKVGLDTDTWTLVLMPRPFDLVTGASFPDTIGSVPWLAAANGGSLDGADFQVDEAYFASLPTWPMPPGGAVPTGCRTVFAGSIAQIDTTNLVAVLTVQDYRWLFGQQMPRNFFQAQCRHMLFDAGCNASGNMNASSFAESGTAQSGTTQTAIIDTSLATPGGSGTYALGKLQMTSGLNSGFWRLIKSWNRSTGTLSLNLPLPFAVAAGDTFTAYPGCDKLYTTCQLFQPSTAVLNYGGQPYIPAPETAS